jgi:protein ImuA
MDRWLAQKTVCPYSILVDNFPLQFPLPLEAAPAGPCVSPRAPIPAASPRPDGPSAGLEELHPALWRAHQLGRPHENTCASGFAALDAELPGGGWPHRALTELMLPHAGVGEFRLLAPALSTLQRAQRPVLLFDPPALPCAWSCQALGLDLQQLMLVRSRPVRAGLHPAGRPDRLRERLPAADLLWTLEQTLASGHAGAVLAWLPATLGNEALRRLQLAAQAHDGPAFVLRDVAARHRPSVATLRLMLAPQPPDGLVVRLLKRKGPPLAHPLQLALAPVLSAAARRRAATRPGHAASRAATA